MRPIEPFSPYNVGFSTPSEHSATRTGNGTNQTTHRPRADATPPPVQQILQLRLTLHDPQNRPIATQAINFTLLQQTNPRVPQPPQNRNGRDPDPVPENNRNGLDGTNMRELSPPGSPPQEVEMRDLTPPGSPPNQN